MYHHEIDETNATLLGVYSGTRSRDDVQRHVDAAVQLDRLALAQGRGSLVVVVPGLDYPSPNSSERQCLADMKDACLGKPNLFILVTRSPLLRGVMTAIAWLSRADDAYRSIVCEDFSEALEAARAFRPKCVYALGQMEGRVHRAAILAARPHVSAHPRTRGSAAQRGLRR